MSHQSFEDLEVWKRSCRLAVDVYRAMRDCRDYGLRDQMQRSAVSVPSNIAEGSERTRKDFIRFLRIAIGSAAELRTQCYIACEVGLLERKHQSAFVQETKELSRMMQALIRRLEA